jgi:phytanoyl-CoA hydroxylase
MLAANTPIIEQLRQHGFAVARGVIDRHREIGPVIAEYERLLDDLATKWHAEGKLSSTYSQLPFGERLIQTAIESPEPFIPHFEITLPFSGITKDTPMHLGTAVFNLLRSRGTLDLVETVIGSEILVNPVQHIRMKLPEGKAGSAVARNGLLAGTTGWHQDLGAVLSEADFTDMTTVWIPITESTVENGCLLIVPGSHRHGLAFHCPNKEVLEATPGTIPAGSLSGMIPAEWIDLEHAVAVPMTPGDVLVMHRLTKHASLPNRSDGIRWSFDLRYQPIGQPTGRPMFPSFVARSRTDPSSEVRDVNEWRALWRSSIEELTGKPFPKFNRWAIDTPVCA